MKPVFYFVILVSMFVGLCPESNAQAEEEPKRPAVFLALECAEKDRMRFRLSNRTPWVISVPTYKHYFAWIKDGESRKPTTGLLATGEKVFVLPDDVGIDSIMYFLEREVTGSPLPLRETKVSGSHSYNISWIDKNSSIIFSIENDALETMRRFYIKFRYEWELSEKGVFFAGLNEHLAEFRLDPEEMGAVMECK